MYWYLILTFLAYFLLIFWVVVKITFSVTIHIYTYKILCTNKRKCMCRTCDVVAHVLAFIAPCHYRSSHWSTKKPCSFLANEVVHLLINDGYFLEMFIIRIFDGGLYHQQILILQSLKLLAIRAFSSVFWCGLFLQVFSISIIGSLVLMTRGSFFAFSPSWSSLFSSSCWGIRAWEYRYHHSC